MWLARLDSSGGVRRHLLYPGRMSSLPECRLTRKGLNWARTGHPWVYRDDLASAAGEHGDVVRVTFEGRTLGTAFLGTHSKIALRWIERAEEPRIPDAAFWTERVERANARRAGLAVRTDAYRVVHDAADGVPGLVVDRYGSTAVVQTTIAGTERLLPFLAESLPGLLGVESVIARNDLAVREKESLPREVRVLAGECPERLWVREDGPGGRIEFPVSPREGQKTGAYLDQRENRWRAAELARGRMLDAFSHAGLFALHAARRCTEAVAVDTSEPALALCEEAATRNSISNVRCERKNVFDFLKEACGDGDRFDVVVLDPPAFAKSRGEVPAAVRGYREINRRAMELLAPGGILVTCSCSYNLSETDFIEVLRAAAADARADFRVIERRTQASDHPILLCHPESAYLKCSVLEKVG
jgi:23S rRNA (cytosine1962-C5)-methyltransferase